MIHAIVMIAAMNRAPSAYEAKLVALAQRMTDDGFRENPTYATDSGIHLYDDKLADYSTHAQAASFATLRKFRNVLAALQPPASASVHEKVDYLLLRANIESSWWQTTVLRSVQRNPTVYEGECTNGIFSLIKKKFTSDEVRLRDAIARMNACSHVLADGKTNLTETVPEFAQIASEDIAYGDALYTSSLDTLAAGATPKTRTDLKVAQKKVLAALHAFKTWLDTNAKKFHGSFAVGKQQYEWYLRHALLLPYGSQTIDQIGTSELARDRALEQWEIARDAHEPKGEPQPAFTSKAAFLKFYETKTKTLIAFVKSHDLVTIPPYLGAFHIVEVPKALASTYPGGFMNPPGAFDKDPEGFYFVPDYDPKNISFFAAQARVAVMPVLGHEGIPGHFLQFSEAYHNPDLIRHIQGDEVFAEGWAFYNEELLMREGLYDRDPASRQAVLHLMRHRATRVGVDVGLATGEMSLPAAIAYFKANAGIDDATAKGEAVRFAMYPGQAIDYLIGKMQIETLLGLVADREGKSFALRRFHDRLLSYGTVPYSTVRWEWLNDATWIDPALETMAPQSF
ncbi:MAG: DUF885 domain-containing protein [Candidatus Eremiobacteraeota bacterium]|nr:DUF885 domain-containing protein [Candidatus Eremiobacteraeota bacterium]